MGWADDAAVLDDGGEHGGLALDGEAEVGALVGDGVDAAGVLDDQDALRWGWFGGRAVVVGGVCVGEKERGIGVGTNVAVFAALAAAAQRSSAQRSAAQRRTTDDGETNSSPPPLPTGPFNAPGRRSQRQACLQQQRAPSWS